MPADWFAGRTASVDGVVRSMTTLAASSHNMKAAMAA
jgi:hypothetical protein